MKKISLTSALAFTVIVGGVSLSANSVFAATIAPQTTTGQVTFTAGELTLDNVPNLDFGSQTITATDQTYNANAESQIKVTDLRGSSAGWNLTVKADKLKSATSQTELVGAQISFAGGTVINSSGETVTAPDVTLTPETAVNVLQAAAGNGNGETTSTWATTGVKLAIPGASKKVNENYTANLEWTLTDAPA